MNRIIRDVYYNSESPACFAGINAVLRECQKRDSSITRKNVVEFLEKQDAYTLHKQRRVRFKRNVTKTSGIDVDWQADLADMKDLKFHNSHYTYILVCVDVLSRHGFAVPIKRKTPEHVVEAFKEIFKQRKPWKLTTDKGTEFKGAFKDFCYKEDIQHRFATSPDVKCAIAERYIRTLKSRIWRYFTRYKTKRYIDVLPDIVAAINNSYHRTIKTTPASVTKENQNKVWETLYGKPIKSKAHFRVGDRVRISIEKGIMFKGYKPNYSNTVYTVSKILNRQPATYKLKEIEDGVFYNEELVRVAEDQPVRIIQNLKKSERRNGELWHLVKFADDKKDHWIKNDELVSI